MDIFDNCRICLCEINHEPIKMTRLVLKFLEKYLQLTNVTKPIPQDNVKLNLCAPCFNKISEFQDFHEQCKGSDEFWKSQFDDFNEHTPEKQLTFEQTVLMPLGEESSSLEADTTVSTTEQKTPTESKPEKKAKQFNIHSLQSNMEEELQDEIMLPTSEISKECEEEYAIKIEDYNSTDLTIWPEETIDDDGEIHIHQHSDKCDVTSFSNTKDVSEEIIEFEYQLEEEEVEIEETPNNDEPSSSFGYEKINTQCSSESTNINENIKNNIEETTQNAFLITTTIDGNGKVKMFYKCQHCDKKFNRVYDIESHYNIHIGVKPYTCNVCGKSFRQKNILTTHQTLHFGKKVECAECGKKFARRSQLILHYRMHRNEKPFVCNIDECQAAFRQRKQLIDHSFIHTGEKNFQCITCTKSFQTRKRLQDHIYKVHSQHRYRCDLCEKAFLKPHMLKHHMFTAHNVEINDVSHLKTLVEDLKTTSKKSRSTTIIN